MPTYEYQCRDCGQGFEKFRGMAEKRVKKCPICGGALKRLIGAGAGVIIFRGNGFYETDYKQNARSSG